MVAIPRSATLTETFIGTHPAHGCHVTYKRYGNLIRGGRPIEWVSCETVWPSGTTRSFTSQATGSTIREIDEIFAKLAARYTVNASHTRHAS
ncbi:hypothetical protein [Catenulispora rubra]|uniref:hypothetical protein n=1 Tax=Catenulispora rubra TaxID=280293 RepID=UPI0018921287|nr:hypothetical protein [Catenulispora rubra]